MDFFDLHCDTIYECYFDNQHLLKNQLAVSMDKASSFDKYAQVFALFIPDSYRLESALHLYKELYSVFIHQIEECKDYICFCKNTARLKGADKHAAILSVEGGHVLGGDLSVLDRLSKDGVKLLTLTWNADNEIGSGSVSGTGGGLTPFGKQAIERMNELSIIPDVSHLSDNGVYDVLSISSMPPVATHSNLRSVFDHPRNLSDELFSAICERGGLVGINLYPAFLGSGNIFDCVYRHITRALELGGEDNIAFGTDFDGAKMDPELSALDKMTILYDYLLGRGISQYVIDKLFFNNAYYKITALAKE